MDIEVLLSCYKCQNIDTLLSGKNIDNVLICDQKVSKVVNKKKANVIVSNEEGLSKSRNVLINNASGDIEIITDDDITFVKDYEKIVKNAYQENPNADVIVFNYQKGNIIIGDTKKHAYNKYSILKVQSVQITFKRKSIIKNNVLFNENFGVNAHFSSGEENIFLADCLKKGLKVMHIPIVICNHPDENTTGQNFSINEIKTKGAVCYAIYGDKGFIYKYYMAIFKYFKYRKVCSFRMFFKYFNEGKKEAKALMNK